MKQMVNTQIDLNSADYKKILDTMSTIKKQNKPVMIKFTLGNLHRQCVEEESKNKYNCSLMIQADGLQIIWEKLEVFADHENLPAQFLQIVYSSISSINNDPTALAITQAKIPEKCVSLNEKSSSPFVKEEALKLLNKLSNYEVSHEDLLAQGILKFIESKMDYFNSKELSKIKVDDQIVIARIFDIIRNLGKNEKNTNQIAGTLVLNKLLQFYQKAEEISFLKSLLIKTLLPISQNEVLKVQLKQESLNMNVLACSSLNERNFAQIKLTGKFLQNMVKKAEVQQAIDIVCSPSCSEQALVYLGFISSHPKYIKLFQNDSLIQMIIQKLVEPDSSEAQKVSCINILKDILHGDKNQTEKFLSSTGLQQTLTFTNNSQDENYFFQISLIEFYKILIENDKDKFFEKIKGTDFCQKLLDKYNNLDVVFVKFFQSALTNTIALHSIEFHKNEATRAILVTKYDVDQKLLVPIQLALNYLACESLSVRLLQLFAVMVSSKYIESNKLQEKFFETTMQLMRTFKNSKVVYENLFIFLSQIQFSDGQIKLMMKLNYFAFLCDKVWTKHSWRKFFLYSLRSLENMMKTQQHISILKETPSAILLIASIRNFINEEDYNDFEENFVGDEEERDSLTYNEEREVHKKSPELINELIDTVSLDHFRLEISKLINNFKTNPQTITIIRANYAVLTIVNGINTFGSIALKQDDQDKLMENIEKIEVQSKRQDFRNKEKLLGDCIKAIANFVGITHNANSKDLYVKKEISFKVFSLLDKYLGESKSPLKSYVMLKVFKEWLQERIDIIENAERNVRWDIYARQDFMMVALDKREELIQTVIDTLYSTYGRFEANQKVVTITFEVIVLLGYVYPEWPQKIGNNFIPNALDVIDNEDFTKDTQQKAIEMIAQITGCDQRSENPDLEKIDLAVKKGAIEKITDCIARNEYDDAMVQSCSKLFENIGKSEEHLEDSYNLIDKLIQEIREYNATPDKLDQLKMMKVKKAVNQLNAICLIEPLRLYAFQKDHTLVVNDLFSFVNDSKEGGKLNSFQETYLTNIEKACCKTMILHQDSAKSPEDFAKLYGKNTENPSDKDSLVNNALRSLKINNQDPELVLLGSKIVNKCFPSPYQHNAKAVAKKIEFLPILDNIMKEFGESGSTDLSKEVKELYVNLSENQDKDMMERMLRKLLAELQNSISKGDVPSCIEKISQLLPFVDHPIFKKLFEELLVDDYILRILKLLHKNTNAKTKKNSAHLLEMVLSSDGIPDLGSENRKLLTDDIKLAKHITDFCLKLPDDLRDKVRKRDQIIELFDIAGILNGSTESFQLHSDFLQRPENSKIMKKNKSFPLGVFLLMKNNQDCFKLQDLQENVPLRISSLQPRQSKVQDLQASQLSMQMSKDFKGEFIQKNVKDFTPICKKLVDVKDITDLFKLYINAMNGYTQKKPKSLEELIGISRQIAALLAVSDETLNLNPYAEGLKNAFTKFLKEANKDQETSPKAMKLFSNNFNEIAKRLKMSPKNMESAVLWNEIIKKFLTKQPQLLKQNSSLVFENIDLASPRELVKAKKKNKFNEKIVEFSLETDGEEVADPLDKENQVGVDKIQENIYKAIQQSPDETLIMKSLCSLTNSPCFARSFVSKEMFDQFLDRLNDCFYLENKEKLESHVRVLDNVVQSLQTDKEIAAFQKHEFAPLIESFILNVQDSELISDFLLETLNKSFDFIPNKVEMKHKNFPKTVADRFKKNPESQQLGILLCKLAADPHLASLVDQELFNENFDLLQNHLYSPSCSIQNPPFENFQTISELSKNPSEMQLEVRAFIFGDLSKKNERAKALISKPIDDPMNAFNLFDQFERFGHIPILACKTLHAMRNCVMIMENEDFKNNPTTVQDLLIRLPPQIERYSKFEKTPQFLQEIYERLKLFSINQLPQSSLEDDIQQIAQKEDDKEKLDDLDNIAKNFKLIAEKLEAAPLSNKESKCFEDLNRETSNILELNDPQANESMASDDIPLHLRLIANSPNSKMVEKQEALELLNKFAQDEESLNQMLKDDFYTKKSQELIGKLLEGKENTSELGSQESLVLQEDLEFMKNLTNKRKGVELVLADKPQEIIRDCLSVLFGENENIQLKVEALKVLLNLVNFGNDKELEKKLLDELKPLIQENSQHPQLVAGLVELAKVLNEKNDQHQKKMIADDILSPLKKALQLHNNHDLMNTEISDFLNILAKDNQPNQDYIMNSEILPEMIESFQNRKSPKAYHQNMAELLVKLGYGNNERKKELSKQGWIKGLVALLIHYSGKEEYDEDMISVVLKLMANFSLIPEGVEHLLFDGVIPAFHDFFDEYKEKLPDQNEMMLQTLVNLAYERNEAFSKKIIDDKGIELILKAMEYYNNEKNEKNTETAVDALTLVCHSPQTLDYLEKKKNRAVDILVDILRQKLGSNLVYKSLRCLTNLAASKSIEQKILKKDAQRATADLFKDFREDPKVIFQSVKFLSLLVKNNPDKLEDFIFAGIPEKIISNFEKEWPVEIIKEVIALFNKMVVNSQVKDLISETFLDELVPLLEKYFKNKNIVQNGIHLLSLCSDNIIAAETVQRLEGNQLADAILKNYLSSEKIIYDDLVLMENTIRKVDQSKPDFLEWKTDFLVENIVETTNPETQKKLNSQAVIVLNLLRDTKDHNIQDTPLEEGPKGDAPFPQMEILPETEEDMSETIPPNVKKFLTQGKVLRVYGEDKECKSMHVYLSNDMNDLRCKHPKENHVKQKWLMQIHQIKQVKEGYEKNSPIAQSGHIFKRAPKQEQCFVVYGPTEMGWVKNFYIKCDNKFDAAKWVEYLNKVLEDYKTTKAKNLKRDQNV